MLRKTRNNLHVYIDADYYRDNLSHLRLHFTPEILKCYVNTCLKRITIKFC